MTMTVAEPRTAGPAPRTPIAEVVARWLLLAACLAAVVTVLATAERPGRYADLRQAVAAGDVGQVLVTGWGTAAPYRGAVHLQVHWRDGLVRRVADVVEARPRRAGVREERGPGVPVVGGSVVEQLEATGPDVEVTRERAGPTSDEVLGWRVLPRVHLLLVALVVVTLLLVVAGPRPWRATRWAWGWLVLIVPLAGVPAYLLLGGPLSRGATLPGSRRLRGGWAFVLALVLSGAAEAMHLGG